MMWTLWYINTTGLAITLNESWKGSASPFIPPQWLTPFKCVITKSIKVIVMKILLILISIHHIIYWEQASSYPYHALSIQISIWADKSHLQILVRPTQNFTIGHHGDTKQLNHIWILEQSGLDLIVQSIHCVKPSVINYKNFLLHNFYWD